MLMNPKGGDQGFVDKVILYRFGAYKNKRCDWLLQTNEKNSKQ